MAIAPAAAGALGASAAPAALGAGAAAGVGGGLGSTLLGMGTQLLPQMMGGGSGPMGGGGFGAGQSFLNTGNSPMPPAPPPTAPQPNVLSGNALTAADRGLAQVDPGILQAQNTRPTGPTRMGRYQYNLGRGNTAQIPSGWQSMQNAAGETIVYKPQNMAPPSAPSPQRAAGSVLKANTPMSSPHNAATMGAGGSAPRMTPQTARALGGGGGLQAGAGGMPEGNPFEGYGTNSPQPQVASGNAPQQPIRGWQTTVQPAQPTPPQQNVSTAQQPIRGWQTTVQPATPQPVNNAAQNVAPAQQPVTQQLQNSGQGTGVLDGLVNRLKTNMQGAGANPLIQTGLGLLASGYDNRINPYLAVQKGLTSTNGSAAQAAEAQRVKALQQALAGITGNPAMIAGGGQTGSRVRNRQASVIR